MTHRIKAALIVALAGLLALPALAGAATRTINVGMSPADVKRFTDLYDADVNAYFPATVTIRRGDTVRFAPLGFHTVDFPRPGGTPLPLLSPTGETTAGVNDEAGTPFWFNGRPQLELTPRLISAGGFEGKRRTYTGNLRIDSGLPVQDSPKAFRVTFPSTGTFTYHCNLHPGMKGTVRVVGRNRSIPSAAAVASRRRAEVARDLRIAKDLFQSTAAPGQVNIGVGGSFGVEYYDMVPKTTTVPVGTTLRFRMTPLSREEHSATFGPGDPNTEPNSYLGTLAKAFDSDQRSIYPSDPLPGPLSFGPTTHGNGFWNTGLLDTSPTPLLPRSALVTFNTPGTYNYYCLIHTGMKGTVIVQ